jgi:polyhydroxybutyrate depolymerase
MSGLKFTAIVVFSLLVLTISESYAQETEIPKWLKLNAKWWADGNIDDAAFVNGIQFLIKNGIMKIPETTPVTTAGSDEVPAWIKNNAGWWADGTIDDKTFVQGIQYLVSNGIIKVSSESAAKDVQPELQEGVVLEKSTKIGTLDRDYIVYLPKGYDSSVPVPLVLVFHGGEGWGKQMMKMTGYDKIADDEKFIVIFPDGYEKTWNGGKGDEGNTAEKANIDDVSFVKQILKETTSQYNIDKNRIFATGMSSGGLMSYRLGCEMADTFAAIGPVVANIAVLQKDKCIPSEQISLININGEADTYMPINGGDCCKAPYGAGYGGKILSTEDTLKIFINTDKCSPTPTEENMTPEVDDRTSVTKRTYGKCEGNTDVVSYIIHGGGHQWPPYKIPAVFGAGKSSQNIDASKVIWDFFKNHPNQ